MEKQHIIKQIQKIAASNGGEAPGWRKLQAEAGINYSDWCGVHWARWNDALADAGFGPNQITTPYSDTELLGQYASLALQLGHLPTGAELRLNTKKDSNFPSDSTFRRLGSKLELAQKLVAHCGSDPKLEQVMVLASEYMEKHQGTVDSEVTCCEKITGYVYMLRYGKKYKIGHTSSPTRRFREVRIELPDETHQIHTIPTDDPSGIEAYWHKRFAAKRIRDSEWFELTNEDVIVFKRRKYQ